MVLAPLLSGLALLASPSARGEEDEQETAEEEIVVEEPRARETPAQVTLDRDALEAFPASSADELLRAMPGLHLSAHGGHGKAYQYFVRGFDAVHGADLAISLEGIPLNEVSHIHGQGYLDLHFLPTVLIRGLDLWRGSSRPEAGDFALAASADLALGLADPGLLVEAGGGTDRSGRGLVTWRPAGGEPEDFVVVEGEAGRGVGDHRAFRQVRLAGGMGGWLGSVRVRAFALGYDGTFESPGVVREDDVSSGGMDFYGAYPEAGGGRSSRLLAGLKVGRSVADGGWHLLGWGGLRALELRRNFTGYARYPDHGDGVLQAQEGQAAGLRLRGRRGLKGIGSMLEGGVDVRADRFDQREQGLNPDGTVWVERVDARVVQGAAGAWADLGLDPWPWLSAEPGFRVEALGIRLLRRIDDAGATVAHPQPADSWAPVLCPKVRLSLFPDRPWTAFATWGRGFRSPEARGIEDGDRAPVATADTAELGLRWGAPAASLTLVGFHTTVSNEIVFDHAAARFLSSGATRRLGGEAVAGLEPFSWLRGEAEVTWADGRYQASGEALPYAPRWLASTGLYARRAWSQRRVSGGLRGWYLGPRPLPEGFYSHPAFVVDATAHAEWRQWVLDLEVDNLLGTRWRDGEFVYPSWFDQSRPESELPVLHVTAGDPFAIRIALGRRFS